MTRRTMHAGPEGGGPTILYVCGSLNQTTQLHAVARAMGPHRAWFSPFFGGRGVDWLRRLGLIEGTIGGNKRRGWCLEYLVRHGLRVDLHGARGDYDLVVTCTDLVVPKNLRKPRIVVVQEGILDPERVLAWLCRRTPLPRWVAGTALTGESGLFERFCVASPGYRDQFVARGADSAKVVVTGIPNFDDCRRYLVNDFPHRDYVLAATSDTRETFKLTDRRATFVRKVLRLADGRPVVFKLHPNEDEARARAEILRLAPDALVLQKGSAEEMVANCTVLVTEWSSVAFVGIALGKEVHSNFPRATLESLCPIQNRGQSATNIAAVCNELLGRAPARVGAATSVGM